jgi:hypothetical protein
MPRRLSRCRSLKKDEWFKLSGGRGGGANRGFF